MLKKRELEIHGSNLRMLADLDGKWMISQKITNAGGQNRYCCMSQLQNYGQRKIAIILSWQLPRSTGGIISGTSYQHGSPLETTNIIGH